MIKFFLKIRQIFLFLIISVITLTFLQNCKNKDSLLDPLDAGWKGEAVCEVLQDNVRIRVLKCTFPPNVGHEKHYHNAYFGYAIAGGKFRIKDTSGIREVNIPTGSDFFNEGIDWHEVLNIGDSTAVFLIIEPK